jgi:hypothetical protein
MTSDSDDLANLDAEALRRRYAECVLLHERTPHVGHANRIFSQIRDIGERLVTLGGMSERELLPLLNHASGPVRRSAAFDIRPFNRGVFQSAMEDLVRLGGAIAREAQFDLEFMKLREEQEIKPTRPDPPADPNWLRIVNWQENNPAPPAITQALFEDRVLTEFPTNRAQQILALARPAIGLWPQREAASKPTLGSRHCGEVWAPSHWDWPIYEEEPMYFLGQIYCPDLAGLSGAETLPQTGLLTFFGDFDAIAGCEPAGSPEQGAVYHWPIDGLVPTKSPLPLAHPEEQMAISLVFRPFIDLPHPRSAIVRGLVLNEKETELYGSLRDALRETGIPEDVVNQCDLDSKLLGWPDLVQDDFWSVSQSGTNAHRLLAQLPARLGPGGSLYFFITDDDLTQYRFDRCILDEQNT